MEIVNKIIEAYIAVYGEEKWDALTGEQQHDAIMCIVKDFSHALDA